MIPAAAHADVGAFLVRLTRLDPAALVRLRPASPTSPASPSPASPTSPASPSPASPSPPGTASPARPDRDDVAAPTEIWARLPFRVLVSRFIDAQLDADTTVSAAALLRWLAEPDTDGWPPRQDEDWRWPLPSSRGRAVERVPASEIARVAQAASRTLHSAAASGVGGRAVGERMVREALLDHVPIVVTGADGERVEVVQRLVQAVVRMGFLGRDSAGDASKTMTFGDTAVTVRLATNWIGLDALYGSAWFSRLSRLQLR